MDIRFEWNIAKAIGNLRKHGVSFADAAVVFKGPHALIEFDRIDDSVEYRWQAIGLADGCVMLVVIHITREEDDVEIVRIISARRAERKERRRYENENG
jgi:uncharacterized DUF497 family protein